MNETDDVDILVTHWSPLLSSIFHKHAPIKSSWVSEKYSELINCTSGERRSQEQMSDFIFLQVLFTILFT